MHDQGVVRRAVFRPENPGHGLRVQRVRAEAVHGLRGEDHKPAAPQEITTVNDIVWMLAERGILTDKALWLKKLEEDSNAYWLARKTVVFLRGKGV